MFFSVNRHTWYTYTPYLKFIVGAAVLFCSSFPFAGQENVTISPKEIFVGDTAVLSYVEKNIPDSFSSDSVVTIPVENIVSSDPSVSVKAIRIRPSGGFYVCEIVFVPWETGELFLPRFFIDKAAGIASSPVSVSISSLVEKHGVSALAENRPPMLAPGTLSLLYAFVFLVGAVVFFSSLCIWKLFFAADKKTRMPLKKVKKLLFKRVKKLEGSVSQTSQSEWYGRLSMAVRQFFCEVANRPEYAAADARDFSAVLNAFRKIKTEGGCASCGDAAADLQTLLYTMEKIRFSGTDSATDSRKSHLHVFTEFASLLFSCGEDAFAILEENHDRPLHLQSDCNHAARGQTAEGEKSVLV